MSALNADPAGPSRYLRSKGEAEAIVAASGLDWTIFRPSVIFGARTRSSTCSRAARAALPVIALAGADARFQPVYVGDVAHCFAAALATAGDDRRSATTCAARRSTRCASSCATSAS